MNRQSLHNILSEVAKVSQLSNRLGSIKTRTIILKQKTSVPSMSSSVGTNLYWDIMCYVPGTSIVALDNLVEQVTTKLKEHDIQITNVFGEDYYDEDLGAYMSSIEVITPKAIL